MKPVEDKDLEVLGAMLADPMAWHYGMSLSRTAGLAPGTCYPTFGRLEASGWVESRWDESGEEGQPRRRFYRLTGLGQRVAAGRALDGVGWGKRMGTPRRRWSPLPRRGWA